MPVAPDLSIFGKNKGLSDYQRANDEFAMRKALQQAQIMQSQAQTNKLMQPEQMTPYQRESLDLQKRRLDMAMASGGSYVDENGEIIQGVPKLKALPSPLAKAVLENRQNLSRAQKAFELVQGKNVQLGGQTIQGDNDATGFKGYLPNQILNRVDPKGVATRAAIADLGSLVIHDRSGAAVTAAEFPRLAPFIPNEKDDQKTVQTKLKNFVATYKQLVDDGEAYYKETGYRVPEHRGDPITLDAVSSTGGGWTIEEVQ